jgi:hypothetical protein
LILGHPAWLAFAEATAVGKSKVRRSSSGRRSRAGLFGDLHAEDLADDREQPSRGETRPVKRCSLSCAYEVS